MNAQQFDDRGFSMPTFLQNCRSFKHNMECIDRSKKNVYTHYWTWKPVPPFSQYIQQPGSAELPESGTYAAVMYAVRKCDESAAAWKARGLH